MSSDAFKMAASTTKEDQAEVEKQQLELTDIKFAVLRDRQVTLRELQADLTVVTGQPVSHSLISRRLSEKGLNARRPRKKSTLRFDERVDSCY